MIQYVVRDRVDRDQYTKLSTNFASVYSLPFDFLRRSLGIGQFAKKIAQCVKIIKNTNSDQCRIDSKII